jgi:hypothetical protein
LALSAALYPPALFTLVLLLSGSHPRALVLSYYAGAALMVVGVGLAGLFLLQSTSPASSNQSSSSASGWADIVVGLLLLGLAAYAWKRRSRLPKPAAPPDGGRKEGRIASLSRRATTSDKVSFELGLVMFLPSPMYLLAISDISTTNDSTGSKVTAVLICAVAVMLFVEIPLIGMFVRPDSVTSSINTFNDWLRRNGWTFAAGAAFIAGIYAVIEGIAALT